MCSVCVSLPPSRFLRFPPSSPACCLQGGELKRHGVLDHRYMNWRTGNQEYLAHHPARLFEWLIYYHPIAIAIAIFLALAGLLLSCFFSYQASA